MNCRRHPNDFRYLGDLLATARAHFPPAPTTASGVRAAEMAVEDFIAVIPVDRIAEVLAQALIEMHGPQLTEHFANVIGRQAHLAGRE